MYPVVVKNRDLIEGYILAGGASSRMGVDKAGLRLAGETLLARAINTMSAFTHSVSVIGRQNGWAESELQNVRVIDDLATDKKRRAPIIGLYTALSVAESDWIAVLAVDLPFVTGELLTRLVGFLTDDLEAVVPVQPDGRLQPLCAFYRRDACLNAARTAIDSSDLSLHKLISLVRTRRVEFGEIPDLANSADFFVNLNTPKDFRQAETLA